MSSCMSQQQQNKRNTSKYSIALKLTQTIIFIPEKISPFCDIINRNNFLNTKNRNKKKVRSCKYNENRVVQKVVQNNE